MAVPCHEGLDDDGDDEVGGRAIDLSLFLPGAGERDAVAKDKYAAPGSSGGRASLRMPADGGLLLLGARGCGKTTMLLWYAMRRMNVELLRETRREEALREAQTMIVPDSAPSSPAASGGDGGDAIIVPEAEGVGDGAPRRAGATTFKGARDVLFLCQRHAVESKEPWYAARATPDTYADTLSRIKMKYVNSAQDIKLVRNVHTPAQFQARFFFSKLNLPPLLLEPPLRRFCAGYVCSLRFKVMSAMHCRADRYLPKTIIIDGLQDICGMSQNANGLKGEDGGTGYYHDSQRDIDFRVARVLAHVKHAVDYIQYVSCFVFKMHSANVAALQSSIDQDWNKGVSESEIDRS